MATRLREKYVTEVVEYNNRLFDEEHRLERLGRAVSAARYYLAADPTNHERVFELHGAMHNLDAQRKRVERMRKQMAEMVDNVFENIVDS